MLNEKVTCRWVLFESGFLVTYLITFVLACFTFHNYDMSFSIDNIKDTHEFQAGQSGCLIDSVFLGSHDLFHLLTSGISLTLAVRLFLLTTSIEEKKTRPANCFERKDDVECLQTRHKGNKESVYWYKAQSDQNSVCTSRQFASRGTSRAASRAASSEFLAASSK